LETAQLLETALAAARQAAALHREHLGRVRLEDWGEKGVADFVTHVDRAAEAGILERIRQEFPTHRLLAEEETGERGGGAAVPNLSPGHDAWTWIIDPLDGTTNYLHGYPVYAVSIAVAQRPDAGSGVVLNSATGEEWTATRGAGAFRNGEPISVSGSTTCPGPDRHRLPVQGAGPAAALHAQLARRCRQLRRAPGRLGRAGPVPRGQRLVRRLLGAYAGTLGRGGGYADRARGRRRGEPH
jgi:fructose-1,6-bisphosphatase/inositol monophosphatase family enzyme